MTNEVLTKDQMAKCFNEWMRRYIEEPERFEQEFATIKRFLNEEEEGVEEPSYGESSAAYMLQIAGELDQ